MKRSLLIFSNVLVSGFVAFAGGTITNLNQAELEAALQGGGTVVFGVGGKLSLTNSIILLQSVVLDAGTNSQSVEISGGNLVRLFQVSSNVNFLAKGLILADGRVIGASGPNADPPVPGQTALGAGLLNQGGTVTLVNCTLSNNFVQGGDASQNLITSASAAQGGDASGAAIYSASGTVNLTNCLITACQATGGKGSFGMVLFGGGGQALGGAVYLERGTLNLDGVHLTSNTVLGGSPGANASSYGGQGGLAAGGAIFGTNSVIALHGCTLLSNSVTGGSPPAVVIGKDGAGAGDALGGAVFLTQDSSARAQTCSFAGNSAVGGNGAKIYASGAGRGGAAYNAGHLEVKACSFSGNSALGGPVAGSGAPGSGGAVCSTNSLVINDSTFDGNSAIAGPVGVGFSSQSPAEGGALYSSGLLYATNSTIALNIAQGGIQYGTFGPTAVGPAWGGGLAIDGGTGNFVNLTIAGNQIIGTNASNLPPGPMQGGGLFSSNAITLIRGTIIANSINGGDLWGTITDFGYNICSDGSADFSASGSLNQTDPMLTALSLNGGPTATMALLAGSPARDAMPTGFPPFDQRGVTRPQGPAADIGAFEAEFISAAPAIVTQPTGATVRAGTNVTFTVGASGTAPLIFQWLKDGNLIPAATQSALTISNVQAANAGMYWAVVTNALGTATSQQAVLVVDSTPRLLSQPVSLTVPPGASATFLVSADGPSLTYQWWHAGQAIPGATTTSFTLASAMAGAQGDYVVVVTNFAGSITSAPATLSFDSSALSILVDPKDQAVEPGYSVTFSVLVSGVPPFAYQWLRNGGILPGKTDSSLTLLNVTTNDAADYSVVVTNGYRSVTSLSARLTVLPGAQPPLLQAGYYGQSLTITFEAEAGRSYRLLSCTNFTSWSVAATNVALSSGPLQFVQPIGRTPQSFFRVVTP